MLTIGNRIRVIQTLVVLLIAFALKWLYSTASVDGLRWILAPTTFLVELITGENFEFELGRAGYMSSDNSFLIAASCSGVNFLITAFLMLSLLRLWKGQSKNAGWVILFSAATAYLTTIVANTVRISVAIQLHRMDRELIWVNPDQLHRFEGIFVYFGFLLLLFIVSEGSNRETAQRSGIVSILLRRSWLPLLIYWATTLGIPIANGAYRQGFAFWEHSLFVLLTPLILIFPLTGLHFISGKRSPQFIGRSSG